MSTKVVCHDLGRLLVFGEVATLVETSGTRRVHEEVGWSVQFHEQPSGPWRHAARRIRRISVLERDVSNVGEWVLDFVSGRVVVDVICQTGFIGGIEHDKVHSVLSHTAP